VLRILDVAVLSALASLVNIPVGGSDFRITFGIVVLMVALNSGYIGKPLLSSLITGAAVCVMRVVIAFFAPGFSISVIFSYFIEIVFYIGYGLLYTLAIVKNRSIYKTPLVAGLIIGDFGGNSLEYFARFILADEVWLETKLWTILGAAIVRSLIIVALVWRLKKFKEERKASAI
jgi:two-component system sensor histidine kinase YcbA